MFSRVSSGENLTHFHNALENLAATSGVSEQLVVEAGANAHCFRTIALLFTSTKQTIPLERLLLPRGKHKTRHGKLVLYSRSRYIKVRRSLAPRCPNEPSNAGAGRPFLVRPRKVITMAEKVDAIVVLTSRKISRTADQSRAQQVYLPTRARAVAENSLNFPHIQGRG